MHCPNCNALNPDEAAWCALCLTRFEPEPRPGASEPDLKVTPADPGPTAPLIVTDPPEVQEAWEAVARTSEVRASGPVIARGDSVSWVCPSCTTENPVKESLCKVCGASFFEAFVAATPEEVPPRDPSAAALLSIVPGVGHFYIKRVGEGVTRLLLAFWWWTYVILVPSPTAAMLGVRVAFGMAAAGLTAVSMYDAYRSATDRFAQPALDRRVIMWTSMALGLLMIVGALTSLLGVR